MKQERSKQAYLKARQYIPGGVNSPARSWGAVGGEPLFFRQGKGCHIWDVDGNGYIDYVCSWGPLILGHANPQVIDAVQEALKKGTSFGAPTEQETELAQLIVEAFPSIELGRLVNSGTEATMSALRVARAFTGRAKVIKFEGGYHGHADALLVNVGSGAAAHGTPSSAGVNPSYAQDTLVATYNSLESVEDLLRAYPEDVACVIVEPVAANMGVVPPEPGFLEGLRQLTTNYRALLIFDEVITGFRVTSGGAQQLYGIDADITCLGKVIGGGLPIGAYGGKKEIMSVVSPLGPMYQAGTLSGNPVATAAGIATLRLLGQPGVYDQLEYKGKRLAEGLREAFAQAGVPVHINRVGSILTPFFSSQEVSNWESASACDSSAFARFFHRMLQEGVYLPPSPYEAAFISLAHTDDDIQSTVEAVLRALR